LFAAGQPISEILGANYSALKYFAGWWDRIQDGWAQARVAIENKK